ncbi:hypothetical protein AQ616_18780 [Oceanobacillus sp. E9]|uniref:hypothetical protein n=1 Tax=Oceanobacillus sp. E9 TaxID=1742575 RepID=UPI00084E6FDE|nr:hypothetical protein [Oceanobacillus sp. E9]OEH52951.1 hypothetical protein AQ616_18780 [Oceanobacillus sp. E9]
MNNEQLEKAIRLKEEIRELDIFISLAKRDGFWERIAFKKEFTLITNVHGFREDNNQYRLSKELSHKVIEVLEKQLDEWKKELENI